jgi:CheY-like chemotaxis protein
MAKIKILLVDDEPDFLELIGRRIEEWGYDLIKATTGKEAVNAVKDKLSDIVILDYAMPDMDGIATLQKIRNIDDKIAVIMFTAYPNEDALKWSEKLNVSAFIPKLSVYSDATSSLKAAIEMAEKRLQK